MVPKKVAKIILAGNPGVGKSSLLARMKKKGDIKSIKETPGIYIESITIGNLEMVFWDFSGQARFREIVTPFFDGANIAVFVFDLSNPETLHSLITQWKDYLLRYAKNAPVLVVGNKKDIKSLSDELIKEAIEKLSKEVNVVGYIETSAATEENVEKLYNEIRKLSEKHGRTV